MMAPKFPASLNNEKYLTPLRNKCVLQLPSMSQATSAGSNHRNFCHNNFKKTIIVNPPNIISAYRNFLGLVNSNDDKMYRSGVAKSQLRELVNILF